MLCFGNAIGDKYSEYIDGKYTAIGSLKNNMFERSTLPVKEKSILFVSQYRRKPVSSAPMMHNMAEAIYWEQFFLPEVFFLPLLSAFCKRNGFQLQVCGCLDEAAEIEKNFYKELLGTDGWEFIPRNEKTISYHLVDTAAYVFMIDSTLGYEAMARGKKVAAFPVRGQVINSEACNFGWPAKVPETGPFWTNTMSENEFDRIMNYILNVNDEEWGNVLRTYISDLLIYDPGNSIFLKLMKQLQVSLN
jgi:surface carbohydrate biosynthesis protein